ncbi:MAG: hypothetical protein QNK37_32460 [Acidobacteriota bacterium]|nr:hypothetical protein [Acidobacteriota bacterium]
MSCSKPFNCSVSRDCAFRLEVKYVLCSEITESLLDHLQTGGVPLSITNFSRHIPEAKDLFSLKLSDHSVATGLVGGNEFVATYGKFGEKTGGDIDLGLLPVLKDRQGLEEKLMAFFSQTAAPGIS